VVIVKYRTLDSIKGGRLLYCFLEAEHYIANTSADQQALVVNCYDEIIEIPMLRLLGSESTNELMLRSHGLICALSGFT